MNITTIYRTRIAALGLASCTVACSASFAQSTPPPVLPADNPGTVTGEGLASGTNSQAITISDEDGIALYSVYVNDGTNRPVKGHDNVRPQGCPESLVIKLNPVTDGGSHRVQYVDCATGTMNAWIVQDYFTDDERPGTPDTWVYLSMPPTLVVSDMNLDNIPDVVVFDGTANTVTVLVGNGDGSLQAPDIAIDRVIQLPKPNALLENQRLLKSNNPPTLEVIDLPQSSASSTSFYNK